MVHIYLPSSFLSLAFFLFASFRNLNIIDEVYAQGIGCLFALLGLVGWMKKVLYRHNASRAVWLPAHAYSLYKFAK